MTKLGIVMSLLHGILRIYVFSLLWGVAAGSMALLLGVRGDHFFTYQFVVAAVLGLVVVLVVLGVANLLVSGSIGLYFGGSFSVADASPNPKMNAAPKIDSTSYAEDALVD